MSIPYRIREQADGTFVLVDSDGQRIDWPALASRAEALAELEDFRRELGQSAADEASERAFLPEFAL